MAASLLYAFTGTDLSNMTIEITKDEKVITSIEEQELNTETYSISDDKITIYFGDNMEAVLNGDKNIITVVDENGSIDLKKRLD